MKYTSAQAGKLIRKLEEKLRDLLELEEKSSTFRVASGEDAESLRPDYDFGTAQRQIEELSEKIRKVKHAINVFNTTHELPGFNGLTIDQALVCLPQLKSRKETLRRMAAHLPKERVEGGRFRLGGSSNIIDYDVINYDRDLVGEAYERVSDQLSKMQLALDTVNTKETMEIDVSID